MRCHTRARVAVLEVVRVPSTIPARRLLHVASGRSTLERKRTSAGGLLDPATASHSCVDSPTGTIIRSTLPPYEPDELWSSLAAPSHNYKAASPSPSCCSRSLLPSSLEPRRNPALPVLSYRKCACTAVARDMHHLHRFRSC